MVRGVMVLMKGVQIETPYKFLGNVNSTGCNNNVVPVGRDCSLYSLHRTWFFH
jgi:hypothetical protein